MSSAMNDEFIKEFIKMADLKVIKTNEQISTGAKPVNEQLKAYLNSIKPYFNNTQNIDTGLIRLEMLKLLYGLAMDDKYMLQQILTLKQPVKTDITSVIEQNFTYNITLLELTYLSGRSLSTFKRDFAAIYNASLSKWIKKLRLEKTKELLTNTSLSIVDITYMSGFENSTHFLRIFKEKYGYPPSKSSFVLKRKIF